MGKPPDPRSPFVRAVASVAPGVTAVLRADQQQAQASAPSSVSTLTCFVSPDRVEAWTSGVYKEPGCGCTIVGNGTLPHPLAIKFCPRHAAVAVPA